MPHRFPEAAISARRPPDDEQDIELRARDVRGDQHERLLGTWYVVAAVGTLDEPEPKAPRQSVILNGDGVVYALRFERGRVTALRRFAENTSFYADQLAGPSEPDQRGPHTPIAFRDYGINRISLDHLGGRDQSNTALVPFRTSPRAPPKLLACYDAGRPLVMDPSTLKSQGSIGRLREDWSMQAFEQLPFPLMFSGAHPVFDDRDGSLFMVNFVRSRSEMMRRALRLVALDPNLFESWEQALELLEPLRQKFAANHDRSLRNRAEIALATNTHVDPWRDLLTRESLDVELLDRLALGLVDPGRSPSSSVPWDVLRILLWVFGEALDLIARSGAPEESSVHLLRRDPQGLRRYRIKTSAGGELQDITVQDSMHQIGVTKNYIVLADTQFKFELDMILPFDLDLGPATKRFLRRRLSRPQLDDLPLYVIRREDLSRLPQDPGEPAVVEAKRVGDLPRGAVHWMVAYDDQHGIDLLAAHGNGSDISEFTGPHDRSPDGSPMAEEFIGNLGPALDRNQLGVYRIQPDESSAILRITQQDVVQGGLLWGIAFGTEVGQPGFDPPTIERTWWTTLGLIPGMETELTESIYFDPEIYPEQRREVSIAELQALRASGGVPSSLVEVVVDRGPEGVEVSLGRTWSPPDGTVLSTPQAVTTEDGVVLLLCSSFTDVSDKAILVFSADALDEGPIATYDASPLEWPFTLHGCWLPSLEPTQENLRDDEAPWWTPMADDLPTDPPPTLVRFIADLRNRLSGQ